MALSKGTNSYVNVAEADAYFADRLDVAAWLAADSASKAQALVTATSVLDDLSWTGTAISSTQPLAFPRSGVYFDPRVGANMSLTGDVPTRILTATKELAYHLQNNDGMLDDTGGTRDISVGSINLTGVRKPNLMPANVKRLIRPLLVNSGSSNWWRAN